MDGHFLHSPPGAGPCGHAPTLAVLGNGDLVCAWYAYPEEECRDAVIVSSRFPAGAAAWDPPRLVPVASAFSAGNPVLFVDPTSRLHLLFVILKGAYWSDAVIYSSLSPDDGLTWGAPQPAFPHPGTMLRHPPIECPDGRLLLPVYEESTRRSFLLESREPWTLWQEACRFEGEDLIQPVLVGSGAGRVTALFRPAGERRRIYRSISGTGDTWSPPIVTPLPSPPSGIAAWGSDASLVAVYNHTEEHRRTPLSMSRSGDRGVTWGPPLHFEQAPFEVSYPALAFGRDGRLHVLFSYNRRMIKHVILPPELFQ